jgi:hypothetical protein
MTDRLSKPPRRSKFSFETEKQRGALNFSNRVGAVADSAGTIANGRTSASPVWSSRPFRTCS